MIKLQITDSADTMEFDAKLSVPITLTPIINETDVQTIDGNISTYYGSTKRQYTFEIGWLDAEAYAGLLGFVQRQYTNLKYPQITVTGDDNLNIENMTAKITLNEQKVTNACGLVEDIILTFRESRQMP